MEREGFDNTLKKTWLDTISKNDLHNFKKGQKVMTTMLREFDRICRKYKLQYWCVGGTLIGAIRHRGWIPFDGDIDVGMLESDYKKLRQVVQKELPNDMWFQDKDVDKNYKSNTGKIRYLFGYYKGNKNHKHHNGIQLDIFIFKHKGDMLIAPMKDTDVKNIKYDMIFPLKEGVFEDIRVYIPNEYKTYSIDSWGGYPPPMPPIEKQKPHEGVPISFVIPGWMKKMYPTLYK